MEVSAYYETVEMPAAGENDPPQQRLLAVCEAMLEAAGRHAQELGVGVHDLHAKGLTWVLARLHVQIGSVPAAGADVRVATWPCGRWRIFALREFQLRAGDGSELLRATSAWALMSLQTRRPARLDPHLPVFASHPPRMIEDPFPPLPPPHPGSARTWHRAEAADIDINDHVNTLVYLGWALGSAPEALRRQPPHDLQIAFIGEARRGDRVRCLTEIGRAFAGEAGSGNGVILLQSLEAGSSGRELTRLHSRWQTGPGSAKNTV